MMFKKTLLAAGVATAALIGAGAAFAQNAPTAAPADHHHHHMGIAQLIREEMQAGRINEHEGNSLIQKIHQMHAERRAERQASESNYAPSQTYGQQPR